MHLYLHCADAKAQRSPRLSCGFGPSLFSSSSRPSPSTVADHDYVPCALCPVQYENLPDTQTKPSCISALPPKFVNWT
jgi:hypothetical protein